SDAHDTIRLSRFVTTDQREFYTFARDEAVGPLGESFLLQPFDAVYVPNVTNFMRQKTAGISGQVQREGIYPIRPDTTTVRDLVEMAGGFRPDASLATAILERRPEDLEAGLAQLETLEAVAPELLTDDEKRMLEVRRLGGETNVVVNFEKLFLEGQDVYNLTLETGDKLRIPRRREEVTVLGAVKMPGIVGFDSDQSIDYFVDMAGGYTNQADRSDVRVLKGNARVQLERGELDAVEPGDTIVVPFEKKRDLLAFFQSTMGTITGLTGLVLTFIAAVR
ncbi:MAG: SLBB domain-containing protein, partial [Gemmatimonadota bacterium]